MTSGIAGTSAVDDLGSFDEILKKFDEQDGKCYWSGLPLKEEYNYIKHHPLAISVERLDNQLGYTYENTVLTRRLYNLGRMAFPEDEFRKVLKEMNTEIANSSNLIYN